MRRRVPRRNNLFYEWEFDKILEGRLEWDAARYAKGYDTKGEDGEEVGVLSALKHGLGAGFKGLVGPMAKESKTEPAKEQATATEGENAETKGEGRAAEKEEDGSAADFSPTTEQQRGTES